MSQSTESEVCAVLFTVVLFEKGSVESTHEVPTSLYRTKHCHAVVAPLDGLTHRRVCERVMVESTHKFAKGSVESTHNRYRPSKQAEQAR